MKDNITDTIKKVIELQQGCICTPMFGETTGHEERAVLFNFSDTLREACDKMCQTAGYKDMDDMMEQCKLTCNPETGKVEDDHGQYS